MTDTEIEKIKAENPGVPVLNEEETKKILEELEKHMNCIACPYFQPYSIDVHMGMIGTCHALGYMGRRKKGTFGKIQGLIMRAIGRSMWTLLVDDCPYYRRARKLEEKGETII